MPIRRFSGLVIVSLLILSVVALTSSPVGPRTLGDRFSWQSADPGSHGLERGKLDELRDILAANRTKALLIVRHDRIVYEWYAPGYSPDRRHYTASLAKSLVGGMSLLLALEDGLIGLDDLASKYIPAWKNDPEKSRITIRHLATHSSGIEDAEAPHTTHAELDGWKAAFWKRSPDPFSIVLLHAPVLFSPGSRQSYSSTGIAALGYAVASSLKGVDLRTLLQERIMGPLGIPERGWSIGYRTWYAVDGMRLYPTWGGGAYTARATARVGQLMLRQGSWSGRQLLSPTWIEKAVSSDKTPVPDQLRDNPEPASGLGWWTNREGVWPTLPDDAFLGAGAGHQLLLIVPSLDLVAVRYGESLSAASSGESFWPSFEKYVFSRLMDAVIRSPYPPSPIIERVTFAPESTIVRKAPVSDNWPITWTDDDHQYAAYGGGWGLDPANRTQGGLGLATLSTTPSRFGNSH
jgi:CubicO group peptidase (beta-lactamase class C family)